MFLDIAGSNVVATRLVPEGPLQTRVLTEYLFLPEDIAEPDFDPNLSSTSANWSLARTTRSRARATWHHSRGFAHGVYPEKDE